MINNKMMYAKDYPYVEATKKCVFDASKAVLGIKSYTNVPANDPVALLSAL